MGSNFIFTEFTLLDWSQVTSECISHQQRQRRWLTHEFRPALSPHLNWIRCKPGLENLAQSFSFFSHNESKALSKRRELCRAFWHAVHSLGIILRIRLVSSRIIQWDLNYSECWHVKSGREHVPVLVCRVFIGGSICFPLQGAAWGSLIYPADSISISCSTSGSSGTFAGSARSCKRWTSFQCPFKDSPFTWRQTWHHDAFGFLVQMADQIDRSTIIIVRCEAKFPVTKLDILETSEFFWEEVNLFRGAVKCAKFCSSSFTWRSTYPLLSMVDWVSLHLSSRRKLWKVKLDCFCTTIFSVRFATPQIWQVFHFTDCDYQIRKAIFYTVTVPLWWSDFVPLALNQLPQSRTIVSARSAFQISKMMD
jgi:hypothetical protein